MVLLCFVLMFFFIWFVRFNFPSFNFFLNFINIRAGSAETMLISLKIEDKITVNLAV